MGTPFHFMVTALDASNAVVTSYAGTIHFTSSDSHAVLPGNSTLTSGTGTLPASLESTGGQTITATDTVTPTLAGVSGDTQVSIAMPAGTFAAAGSMEIARDTPRIELVRNMSAMA